MMTIRLKHLWVGFVSVCVLSSCASVPLTSMPKLAGLKAETIDVSQVELAIRVNDDYRVIKDSAKLEVIFENKLTNKKFQKKIVFPESVAPLTKYLRKQKKPGFIMQRYKLNAQTTDVVNNFRADVLKFKAQNKGDNSMSLYASANFCRVTKNAAPPELLLKFYIKTKPQQKFYTLFKQQKMSFRDKEGNMVSPAACTAKNSYWSE